MTRRSGKGLMIALMALGLILGMVGGAAAAPAPQTGPTQGTKGPAVSPPVARPEVLVLHLYFKDMFERDRLAAEWGADEMATTGGFLTVWADRPTYDQMLAKGL